MNSKLLEALLEHYQRQLQLGSPLINAWRGLTDLPAAKGSTSAEPDGQAASLLDHLRLQGLILEEVFRIHSLLLEAVFQQRPVPSLANTDRSFDRSSFSHAARQQDERGTTGSDHPEAATDESDLLQMLNGLQRLLLLHPVAAQASFSSFVAEGRRFAETDEGRKWASVLLESRLLARLRRVWESATLNMLEEQPTTVLPSVFIEAIFRAARSAQLDHLLDPRKRV
jgi:hypothetical protein